MLRRSLPPLAVSAAAVAELMSISFGCVARRKAAGLLRPFSFWLASPSGLVLEVYFSLGHASLAPQVLEHLTQFQLAASPSDS